MVPINDSRGKLAVDEVLRFLDECERGSADIVSKGDQAPANEYLVKDIVEATEDEKGIRTIAEKSLVRNSGSNDRVERAA